MLSSIRRASRQNNIVNRKQYQKATSYTGIFSTRYANFNGTRNLTSTGKDPERPNHAFTKTYDPSLVESGWYEWWQKKGLFEPKTKSSPEIYEFLMLAPPPNITGVLHLGHALTFSIQDAFARWHRMRGDIVNWIPGTDHAGISTQTVVEKQLYNNYKLTRYDLGREKFVEKIWEWKAQSGSQILEQMLQSVISDIELDHIDIEKPTLINVPGYHKKVQFGVLHNIIYTVVDPPSSGPHQLVVSTTRPETLLGDVAIAINPNDQRYKSLHGKRVLHPILNKEIPIVLDAELVDLEFGTGAVKITPAHDVDDYHCGKRHSLPSPCIFDQSGNIINDAEYGNYKGMNRWEARVQIIEDLKDLGYYDGSKDGGPTTISTCSRTGDIIEPMLKPQWYVRCKDVARLAKNLVLEGKLKLQPKSQVKEWFRWLDNIQDWCISRQLWWGHRIPAYNVVFTVDKSETKNGEAKIPNSFTPSCQITNLH
ncbi:hypothetical protein H4219_001681 [Mycoemilia scoparia]|uniref:valine--tRNA ligase n=1 Tax=Mycoemilia scoparia TaxID=417184 RepID=A0A9W8DVR9_9FUNG|nr:hypothetical protein H4219_001681 [Mycoemilia scoparia]